MTDEQILESWNQINARLGLPPIVKLGPPISYDDNVESTTEVSTEASVATTTSPTPQKD